jgi:hypothetical protein
MHLFLILRLHLISPLSARFGFGLRTIVEQDKKSQSSKKNVMFAQLRRRYWGGLKQNALSTILAVTKHKSLVNTQCTIKKDQPRPTGVCKIQMRILFYGRNMQMSHVIDRRNSAGFTFLDGSESHAAVLI